jgi:MFS family permease
MSLMRRPVRRVAPMRETRGVSAPSDPTDGRRRTNLTVAALSLGTALNPLNSSMIAVALIALQHDFALSLADVTWVITVFYIASVVGQPLMGRIVDAFGPRRTFAAGMVLVVISAVMAPLAGGFALVCVARGLMAVGTSVAFPAAVALVGPLAAQSGIGTPRLLARVQVTNTAGAALGPVIGGILVTTAGWQAVFLVNIPLAIGGLIGVLILAPKDAPRVDVSARAVLRTLDPIGVLTFSVGVVALLVVVLGGAGGALWWLLALAVVGLGLFVWRELRAHIPFIDLRMLAANRALSLTYLGFTVFSALFYLAFFGLPQFLEARGGYSSAVAGLLLLPLAASTVVLAPFVARAIERRGAGRVLVLGAALLVPAAALLAIGVFTTAPVWMLVMAAAMGVPYCMASIAMTQAVQRSAPAGAVGVASGLLQATRYIGAIVATVVLGRVLGDGITPAAWGLLAIAGTVIGVIHLGVAIAAARAIARA